MASGDLASAARIFLGTWGTEVFDDLPATQQDYITDRIWIPGATEPALIHDGANLLPRLHGLSLTTLLVEGALSPPVIDEINTRLAAELPNARRTIIDGASHMAPITHAGPVASAIDTFLDTL